MERKLVLYIAMSLDGYIAAENDDLSFLSAVEQEGEDYGYAEFINTIDTIILGRKTYDKVISMGHPYPMHGEKVYVITRSEKPWLVRLNFIPVI
jgi:dihydrofolate reductase